MKKRKTIKVLVEIEFEYDTEHYIIKTMGKGFADAIAKDMAFENAATNIQDGVRLLHVCDRKNDYWWLINKREEE